MSYNGSGTFQINTSGQPVVAGTVISSTAFNALTADLATGLSTAITKDGQTTTTARIPFAQGINSSLATDSSSTSTGSIITAGGVGIVKNLYVGANTNIAGTLGVTGVATFSAAPIYSSLTASSAVATDASKALVSVTNTGTGNNVLATSPTLVTPVLGAASATSITVDAGAVGTPSITTTGDTNTGIFFPAADTIAFAEGGVEAARIDSSGNMLVGTTTNSGVDTGSQRLVVNGLASGGGAAICAIADSVGRGIRVTDSSKTNTAIYDMTTTLATLGTNQSIPLAFTTVGSERMRINSSGNLLVGTTSISAGRVNVLAAASASGIVVQVTNNGDYGLAFSNASGTNVGRIQIDSAATSYVTSSDYRLKNSISPMTGALAKVALLKPCTYKWNADNSDAEGFIAHELAEVCPQAVSGEKDAVDADGNIISQGIDTSFLVATLTAAIQEQQSLITALTARITALENK